MHLPQRNDTCTTVSIIIKALNEEQNIARAIESAIAALGDIDGEVILADGGSRDRTIEIASRYPIIIVQLNRVEDRSCGAGAQLGYQYSLGRYLLLMDGDMQLHPGFLPAAIRLLDEAPGLAGVGGWVIDRESSNLEYQQRKRRSDPGRRPGLVTRLDCSGLYRRAAIKAIGYLTDRNLHGGEEMDLGARLHTSGWSLARIDRPAVDHYVHTGSAYRLLLGRVATRNSFAMGEALRAAVGRSHFWFVIRHDHNWLLCLMVMSWWLAMACTPLALGGWPAMFVEVALLLLPGAAMSLRWRSVALGLYSVVAWNVYALSFIPGLFRPRSRPNGWIESTVIKARAPRDGLRVGLDTARVAASGDELNRPNETSAVGKSPALSLIDDLAKSAVRRAIDKNRDR